MKNELISKDTFKESYRFAIVGILATIVNFFVNFGFIEFGFSVAVSSAYGYFSGILIGFPLNKFWAFSSTKEKVMGQEVLKYFIVYFITFLLNSYLAVVSYDLFNKLINLEELVLAKSVYYLPVIVITTILNFLGCKIFVFKK